MSIDVRAAALCATALFFALNGAEAAVSWTDYFGGTAPSSGKVTIAAGDEVVIDDSEMEASKSCTVTVADGAVLKLNTSTFPTFSLASSANGTVEKVYEGDWPVATKNQGSFKGRYLVSASTVNIDGSYCKVFGALDALDTSTLYATNGAVIAYNGASSRLGCLPIHLAGSLTFNKTTFKNPIFRFLMLEGDSCITAPETATAFIDQFDDDNPSFIDLNGHGLAFGGLLNLTLKNGSFKGSGNITVEAGTSSKIHLLHLENFGMEGCGAEDVLEIGQYAGISTATPLTIPRKVRINDSAAKFHGPGWTTFSGGLDGDSATVSAFVTNAVSDGMVSFPGRAIVNDTQDVYTYSSTGDGALWIGHCATGGLWVVDGMALTNKLVIGGTENGKAYQIGLGALLQTGGDIYVIGTPDDASMRTGSVIGYSAHGYYEIHGGTTCVAGNLALGMASPGIIAQYGGTFEQIPHPLTPLKPSNAAFSLAVNDTDAESIPSVVYVGGGTMRLGEMFLCHGTASESAITVSGSGSLLETPERIYTGFKDGTVAWVNINDGAVLATPYFQYRNGVDSKIYVSFDGGTLRVMPKVTGSSELTNIFGNPSDDTRPLVTRVTVGPKGAAIDTARRSMSIDVPLSASYGNAVSAIPFTAETGWTVAPYVKIVDDEGEGTGATAFADFDSATGTLKGLRVTSGGWNYTSAKAQMYVNKTMVREIDCTLAAAPAAGSFTKKGEGRLTLTAVNSWSGETVVEGGTLKAGCAGAIPDGTALRLNGGVLDLDGHDATFASIGGTGGSIANGAEQYTVETLDPTTTADLDLSGTTLTVTGNVTVSAEDIMSGRFPVYCANIVFAEGSTVTIVNPELLAESKNAYTLLKTEVGTVLGKPSIANADDLPAWVCRNSGTALKLGVPVGFVMTVR